MPEVTDPLGMLSAAVDALVAADPTRFADRESIKGLYRQLARLEAVTTRATGAFDAGREWEADRARSAASWIAAAAHVPKALAQRRVWLARELRLMDLVERAWLAGDVGEAQAGLLALPGRPHRALRSRRRHCPRQRPSGLRLPQPRPPPTNVGPGSRTGTGPVSRAMQDP